MTEEDASASALLHQFNFPRAPKGPPQVSLDKQAPEEGKEPAEGPPLSPLGHRTAADTLKVAMTHSLPMDEERVDLEEKEFEVGSLESAGSASAFSLRYQALSSIGSGGRPSLFGQPDSGELPAVPEHSAATWQDGNML